MSDNHPKIPPKSRRLLKTATGEAFFSMGVVSDYLKHEKRIANKRDVIAAVAECEWRKRAERWLNLRLRAGDKLFELARKGKTSKAIQYQLENAETHEAECLEMADAWRAWGSGGIWDAALAEGMANNGNL